MFACPICTKPDLHRALCEVCAERLWRRREPTTRDLGAYRTRGLYAWRRNGWLGLRWWSAALKHKQHPVFWREPAIWLIDVFGAPPAHAVLVPVPGTKGRNHAYGFARALAMRSGVEMADVLEAGEERGHQRRLKLPERRGRRYRLGGRVPRGPVILVDDIITSGATVEAAYRALESPAEFEAWCLMDRRPPGEMNL